MTRIAARPPEAPQPDDTPAHRALAAYEAARAALEASAATLAELRLRHAELERQVLAQQRAVEAAGARMAEAPDDATAPEAFNQATAALAALQAQRQALADQVIPAAESAHRQARPPAEAARVAYNRILFLQAVGTRVLPADRRLVSALQDAAEALAACQAIRAELRATAAYAPFLKPEIGGVVRDQLPDLELWYAVPYPLLKLARSRETYIPGQARPDLHDLVCSRFALEARS